MIFPACLVLIPIPWRNDIRDIKELLKGNEDALIERKKLQNYTNNKASMMKFEDEDLPSVDIKIS